MRRRLLTGNSPVSHQPAETGPVGSEQALDNVVTFLKCVPSPPTSLLLQQLSCGKRRWRAASQGEEKQEQQWQHQESGDEESLEPGGGPAGAPAAAQNPHQTSGRQVGPPETLPPGVHKAISAVAAEHHKTRLEPQLLCCDSHMMAHFHMLQRESQSGTSAALLHALNEQPIVAKRDLHGMRGVM